MPQSQIDDIDRRPSLVPYCPSGGRSSVAASLFEREGFAVSNVAGGFRACTEAALPQQVQADSGTEA